MTRQTQRIFSFWPAVLLATAVSVVAGLHPVSARSASAAPAGSVALRRRGGIRPSPQQANADVPRPLHEGCMVGFAGTESPPCVYGDPHGKRTLILFGDSHALQQFPALQVVAKRNRWRLIVWTKRECTPAEATIRGKEGTPYTQCDSWRRTMLKRIEASGPGTTVAISGWTNVTVYGPHDEQLHGRAAANRMQRGYESTLRRIRRAGLSPLLIRDTPEPPESVPSCVSAHLSDPAACDFPQPRRWDRNFDVRAARSVPGTPIASAAPAICPHRRCRAVIGGVLVFRGAGHLTATFDRTLARQLEPTLKRAVGRPPAG